MTLGELIERLEAADPDRRVAQGFGKPHSYRGFYQDLAFEPVGETTVGAMLAAARSAMGTVYEGYKGGDYKMGEWTDVWIANYGSCGEGLGPMLLDYMIGKRETQDGPDWPQMAARYDLSAGRFKGFTDHAVLDRVTQRDGSHIWAIRDHGLVLNKEGEWEYEPMPSSREDDFLERSRYATKEEAFAQWEKFGPCDYPVKVEG